MRSLHSQSATVNLASGATVLSHTVTTATALADLILEVGVGTSDLDASAETTLTVAITVAGVPIRGSDPTETVEVGRTRLRIPVDTFPVALGETVVVTLTSDQAADSAVAVTATLRDASPLQPVTRGRQVKADADGLVELSTESTEMVATATENALAAAHGAGSWEGGVGAAGGGPAPLTVTVETSLGDPIVGAIVYLLDDAGEPLDLWLPTDANGQAVFGLAAGDYQVAVGSLAGYSVPAPAAKTIVASTAATATVVLTRQAADPPTSAALCVIDDYVLDASQQPVVGAVVTAKASAAAVLVNAGILTEVRAKAVTDDDGRFTLSLVRADAMTAGTSYTIEIKHDARSVFRKVVGPIPNAATATLKDIEAGA